MTAPCIQEERITRIEDAVGDISSSVNALSSDMAVIKDRIIGVVDTVKEHEHILKGDSGGLGLVGKMSNMIRSVNRIEEAIYEDGGIKETMKETSEYIKKAAAEKKEMEKERRDNIKWLWRLVAGALITGAIGWVIALLP